MGILDLIAPDSTKAAVKDSIKLIQDGRLSGETKFIKKDGSEYFMQVEAVKLSNYGFIVFAKDITLRMKAEIEVKKLSTAVEQSANCVLITDSDGKIEYVNNQFAKLTGYAFNEVIGENPRILKSGKQTDEFYQELWGTITTGKEWKGEFYNKTKNGDFYWESATITPVLDENNDIINFIAIKEDITERRIIDQRILQTIIDTEEKERKRFAEDLHDELGPFLSGIKLYIKELSYPDVGLEQRLSIIEYLDEFIDSAVEKTRSLSNQLMPNILMDYGLVKALNSFCKKVSNTKEINIEFESNVTEGINNIIEVIFYRIAIELINNTIKHAAASIVNITLNQFSDIVQLTYIDNGKGFDIEKELVDEKGLGLNNIINRLETVRGEYKFESHSGEGVFFNCIVDLSLIQ